MNQADSSSKAFAGCLDVVNFLLLLPSSFPSLGGQSHGEHPSCGACQQIGRTFQTAISQDFLDSLGLLGSMPVMAYFRLDDMCSVDIDPAQRWRMAVR